MSIDSTPKPQPAPTTDITKQAAQAHRRHWLNLGIAALDACRQTLLDAKSKKASQPREDRTRTHIEGEHVTLSVLDRILRHRLLWKLAVSETTTPLREEYLSIIIAITHMLRRCFHRIAASTPTIQNNDKPTIFRHLHSLVLLCNESSKLWEKAVTAINRWDEKLDTNEPPWQPRGMSINDLRHPSGFDADLQFTSNLTILSQETAAYTTKQWETAKLGRMQGGGQKHARSVVALLVLLLTDVYVYAPDKWSTLCRNVAMDLSRLAVDQIETSQPDDNCVDPITTLRELLMASRCNPSMATTLATECLLQLKSRPRPSKSGASTPQRHAHRTQRLQRFLRCIIDAVKDHTHGLSCCDADLVYMLLAAWQDLSTDALNTWLLHLDPAQQTDTTRSLYRDLGGIANDMRTSNKDLNYDLLAKQAVGAWEVFQSAVTLVTEVVCKGIDGEYDVFLLRLLWMYPTLDVNPLDIFYTLVWAKGAILPGIIADAAVCHQLQFVHALLSVPTTYTNEQAVVHHTLQQRSMDTALPIVRIRWVKALLGCAIEHGAGKWSSGRGTSTQQRNEKPFSDRLRRLSGLSNLMDFNLRVRGVADNIY